MFTVSVKMLTKKEVIAEILKTTFLYLIVLNGKSTSGPNPCQEIRVRGATYAKCDGIYQATNSYKVKWAKEKTTYRHTKRDRFIFFCGSRGWCIGKESYIKTQHHFYHSGVREQEPFSKNVTWKTDAREVNNVSVRCIDETNIHVIHNSTEGEANKITSKDSSLLPISSIPISPDQNVDDNNMCMHHTFAMIILLSATLILVIFLILSKLIYTFLNKFKFVWTTTTLP